MSIRQDGLHFAHPSPGRYALAWARRPLARIERNDGRWLIAFSDGGRSLAARSLAEARAVAWAHLDPE
jgi:hypothetical protein